MYREHFPAELGHRKIPKFRKVGSHVHMYIPGIFLRPEVCSLMVADELLRERVEEDVLFKKVISRRANNKRLPALLYDTYLKLRMDIVLPMARRNCTWTTTLHSSTEPRLPRPITGGNVRTCMVDAPTIEEEMLPSPSYRPRCATIYTSR